MEILSYLFFGITISIVLLFIWSKRKRAGRKGAQEGLTETYSGILEQYVSFYRDLNDADQERFLNEITIFLRDVHIEGVGTEVNELDRVLIASSAVIPIFNFRGWRYKNLSNIVLYPDTFNSDFQFVGARRNTLGMVGEGFMNGQMILSKSALHHGFSENSNESNTAIHEFVHLIDKRDGSVDGIPELLLARPYVIPWIKMMHAEMHRIKAGRSDIDPYALTNEAEFLAVVSEYFFEKPTKFRDHHPELFDLLTKMFGKKP
ncbi:zinc-dependent peptidase [Olivibacter jilunii]|uniref:M90 family metallopeptidase n=1 Tax=Olivibacter jilunii TaxID=985016 RepID=UPI003F166B70